jgi:eukaryotic-like serine/threonine-protein kinase
LADEQKELLANLLLIWEESSDSGEEVDVAQLCSQAPELLDRLNAQIAVLKRMAWMKGEDPPEEDTPVKDQRVGTLLANRYQIDSILSYGGFGVVYRGFDTELERPVAIKVARLDRQDSAVGNLLAEAKRIAQLRHPAIVSVFDVVRSNDSLFLIIEFVPGQTLAAFIEQGKPTAQWAAQIIIELAGALQYAHGHGFVHNDIKPANILLDQDDRIRLSDFGSAVSFRHVTNKIEHRSGTLPYMAPELLLGQDTSTGIPSDIYSVGVVFYELLTGRRPFDSSSAVQLREKIIQHLPQQPRKFDATIPKRLETICLKCLCKKADSRYASAAELRNELTKCLEGKNRFAPALFLILALSLFSIVGWFILSHNKPDQVLLIKQSNTHSNTIAFSPDGQLIASGGMDAIIYLWNSETGVKLKSLEGHHNWIRHLVFSADSRILFSASGGLHKDGFPWPGDDHAIRLWSIPEGKEIRSLKGHVEPALHVALSPDGGLLASASDDRTAQIWDIESGYARLKFEIPGGFSTTAVAFNAFGNTVYVGDSNGVLHSWDIHNNRVDGTLTAHQGRIWCAAVSPNKRLILTGGADGTAKLWSERTKALRHAIDHADAVLTVAFSPDSTRFLTGCEDGTVRLFDSATGQEIRKFKGHLGNVWAVAFSPDGTHAASSGNDGTIRKWRLPETF